MINKILLAFLLLSFCIPINRLQAETNNEEFQNFLGRWIRTDAGYALVIESADEEGNLTVQYLNPRKINVSQAHAEIESEIIKIIIELKDRHYPGSYYELHYDEQTDQLVGKYYHLGINEVFDIYFTREEIKKEE